MINVDKWKALIIGDKVTLLSEITVLCKALKNDGFDKEQIIRAVELSFLTEKELEEKANEVETHFRELLTEEVLKIEQEINFIGAISYINSLPEEEQERLRNELK